MEDSMFKVWLIGGTFKMTTKGTNMMGQSHRDYVEWDNMVSVSFAVTDKQKWQQERDTYVISSHILFKIKAMLENMLQMDHVCW